MRKINIKFYAASAVTYFGFGVLLERDFTTLGLVFKFFEAATFGLLLSLFVKVKPGKKQQ